MSQIIGISLYTVAVFEHIIIIIMIIVRFVFGIRINPYTYRYKFDPYDDHIPQFNEKYDACKTRSKFE